ncbi:MAG: cytosine permease, partial [Terrimesophilobacter sp.]
DFDALIGGAVPTVQDEPTLFSPALVGPQEFNGEATQAFDSGSGHDESVSENDRELVTPIIAPRAFRVEESSVEPTLTEQRVGRAARLFWLWFAANSSIVSIAFGGAVLSLGMSLRQAIVATLIGVAVSFLPLGLGTLAGKWSGQPTMVVSRASFGHIGNILPAILALIVRVFWGAVLLWFLAAGTARILTGADLAGPLTETQLVIIGLAVGFLLALVIAFFGYGLIARIQVIFTIISALLIAGLIYITWPAVNISKALTLVDGPWILVLTGSVLVFSFVGLVWAVSSADLARYQRGSGSGAASMLWATFGATIPAFVLIAYGAVLAASNPDVATGLIDTPLDTISQLMPVWYPIPLIAALVFSLLSGVVLSIYSGGFALQATGASMRRSAAVVIVGAAVAALAVLIAISVGDFTLLLRDVATTLAVPVAAWAGIFAAEMMIRNRRFDSRALVMRGGVYGDFRWLNLSMLIVVSGVGYGLTTATVSWLGWQGYLLALAGVPLSSDLAASDVGVFVALILGLLTPIIAGIPGIRRQENGDSKRSSLSAD